VKGTPHIEVDQNIKDVIAKTVLMPGDPLRAKMLAETYLKDIIQFNSVRGMLGYTGTYKGRKISVMGSGMGMPSIGIYSYELYEFYGVEKIIRIGSCGAYKKDINLREIILTKRAWSESTFAKTAWGIEKDSLQPSLVLNNKIKKIAKRLGIPYRESIVHSSDVFYGKKNDDKRDIIATSIDYCSVVEMEAFALFANAKVLGKQAACILTVSNNIATGAETSSEEREKSFTHMMEIALELAE
jgi:purine-nucleoside phosphorylase